MPRCAGPTLDVHLLIRSAMLEVHRPTTCTLTFCLCAS